MFSTPGDLSLPGCTSVWSHRWGPAVHLFSVTSCGGDRSHRALEPALTQEGGKGRGRRRRAGGGEELGAPAWSWEEALDPPTPAPAGVRGKGWRRRL